MLCGLPLSALSSSVLFGCFFSFALFFFFCGVVCESVAYDAASSDEVDSARAVADPATQSAKPAMSGRNSFEDTVGLLRGRLRGMTGPP